MYNEDLFHSFVSEPCLLVKEQICLLKLGSNPSQVTCSRFVWANGRAAGIGITIPVCSIGRLPLLEPLPSLPNIEWKRRQSFRNKMAEAANETSFEDFFF